MDKIYVTLDADGERADQGANIVAFDSPEAACAAYDASQLVPVEWGDCWVRYYDRPSEADLECLAERHEMTVDDLIVCPPGTHPGGRCWWITPRVEVYTPVWDQTH